jgi:hypothetical protein
VGFRNPATTATAIDTGRGNLAAPSFRAYQDVSNPAVPRGIAEWATGLMDRNAQIYLSGGSGNSTFTIDGGATAGKDAPTIGLAVQEAPTSGKESVAFVTGDRLDLSGVTKLGNLARFAGSWNGTSNSTLTGTAPSVANQPELIVQFWNGTLTSSAFGDNTIFLPKAFPNAWLWVGCTTPGTDGIEWVPRNPRGAALDMRLENASGGAVASTARQVTVCAIGW